MRGTGHIPFSQNLEVNHTAITTEIRQLRDELRSLKVNPRIQGDLDMQGGHIVNLGSSRSMRDATNRDELVLKALFQNDQGQHVAHSSIIAMGNIRSRVMAREPYDLVPLWQLKKSLVLLSNISKLILGAQPLTLANGTNDDVEPTGAATVYTITGPTAPFGVSGLTGGTTGRLLVLVNGTGWPMTILDRSNSLSIAANQIATNKGWNMQTQTDGVVIMVYLTSIWRVLAAVL